MAMLAWDTFVILQQVVHHVQKLNPSTRIIPMECVVPNGDLINTDILYQRDDCQQRHVNTDSDSEDSTSVWPTNLWPLMPWDFNCVGKRMGVEMRMLLPRYI